VFNIIFSKLLQKKGITAYKLSKDTGIPQSLISVWKKSEQKPASDNLQKLADYFEVTTDYLLGNEKTPLVNNDEELTEYLEELRTRPELKMLFQLAKGATKEDVEKSVKIIEAFLENK
jgi:transcriptional regulator with XRE-family HTH domain